MATDREDNMQRPPGIAWHMHLVNLLVNDHRFDFWIANESLCTDMTRDCADAWRLSHVSSHASPNNGRCRLPRQPQTSLTRTLWLISFAPPSLAMTGRAVTWIHIISPSIKWTTFCSLAYR